MITPPTVSAELMLNSLAYTVSALDAAANLDLDRTDVDRNFLASQKPPLVNLLNALQTAQNQLIQHELTETRRHQANVTVGDLVLDKGLSNAKARMELELKYTRPEVAEKVFGKNLTELTRTELHHEPALVMQALDRLYALADFPNKAQYHADLSQRANNQQNNITAREQAERVHAGLTDVARTIIEASSEALYNLDKQLLLHFSHENKYVKSFFLDSSSSKSKAEAEPVPPTPKTS